MLEPIHIDLTFGICGISLFKGLVIRSLILGDLSWDAERAVEGVPDTQTKHQV